jgi:predicted N-acetyltransferase YhbS
MQNKFIISFSEEKDFEEIVYKLNKYFQQPQGFFQSYVPVLYKPGKNTHENHIIVKCNDEIVGIIAVKKKNIHINNETFSFVLLGSLAVDFDYRNQGIMGLLFDYILNKYSDEVDFFGLSGSFDRYKRFGFFPSEKMYRYNYELKEIINSSYTFELVNDNSVSFCEELYLKQSYKVERENMIDNLYMWEYKPYLVKKEGKNLGYLIYNPKFNLIEEIILLDNNELNDIIYSFGSFINMNTSLKICINNDYLKEFIDKNIQFEEYFERTLYKIQNPKLKGIYIPRSDLI